MNVASTALIGGGFLLCIYAPFSHRPPSAFLAVGLLVTFIGLAIGVQTQGWVTGLDASTASWFSAHRSHWMTLAALAIAAIGTPAGFAFAGLIGGAMLSWRARSAIPGFAVIGTVGAAALAKTATKAVVATPLIPAALQPLNLEVGKTAHKLFREPLSWQQELLPAQQNSFPSGHVTGTAALLGIIAVCVGSGSRRAVRAWLAGLVVTAVLFAAVSRLYYGVHWLTDVIGGALLGGAIVALGASWLGETHASTRGGRSGAD